MKSGNDRYMNVEGGSMGKGVMGQASKPYHVNPCPNYDIKRVQERPFDNRGTPQQAFDYKY